VVDIYASDAEQAEAIKKWWRENGKSVIGGLVIGLGGVFGWQSWMQHQETTKGRASYQYYQLANAAQAGEVASVEKQSQVLEKEYAGSVYRLFGYLDLAKLKVDAGDLEGARQLLQQVMADASDPSLRQLARLRVARLHIAQGNFAAAEALLGEAEKDGFVGEVEAIKGDIALQKGDREAAIAAYRAALENQAGNSATLRLKLDSLGWDGEAS
jgi:FimV-like protein